MKFNLNKKSLNSIIAGALASVMILLPLSGCGNTEVNNLSSQILSSSKQNSETSEVYSPESKVSSQSPNSKSVKSPSSSQVKKILPKEVPPKKVLKEKTESRKPTFKKITDDTNPQNGKLNSIRKVAAASQSYTYINQRAGYNYLSDLMSRGIYRQLLKSAYKVSAVPNSQEYYPIEKIIVSGNRLSEAQLRIIILAFMNDNPQIFWLANSYSYSYRNNDTHIQLYSVAPQSECNTMIQKLNQKINSVINAIPLSLNEFDRELYLFNYITENCVYNHEAAANNNIWQAFSSYGALVDGKAVCEGYSRAMQLLSSYSGLQCMLITGSGKSADHMWNLMKINGNWYHLDSTWSDNEPAIYNYFNINDAAILQSHTIFPSASTLTESQIDGTSDNGKPVQYNLSIPVCISTEQNYFKVKGMKMSDLNGTNDAEIVNALESTVKAKKPSVSFYVEESADFNEIISGMTTTSPYKISEYFNKVNRRTEVTNKIDLGEIRYVNDRINRGITFFLSYK